MSTDKDDPGYVAYERMVAAGQRADVYLDGNEIPNCKTFDTDEGLVVVAAVDKSFELYCNPDNTVATTTLRGNVTIKLVTRP